MRTESGSLALPSSSQGAPCELRVLSLISPCSALRSPWPKSVLPPLGGSADPLWGSLRRPGRFRAIWWYVGRFQHPPVPRRYGGGPSQVADCIRRFCGLRRGGTAASERSRVRLCHACLLIRTSVASHRLCVLPSSLPLYLWVLCRFAFPRVGPEGLTLELIGIRRIRFGVPGSSLGTHVGRFQHQFWGDAPHLLYDFAPLLLPESVQH